MGRRLPVAVGLLLASCTRSEPITPSPTPSARTARFRATILLAADQIPPQVEVSTCRAPVRGGLLDDQAVPEIGVQLAVIQAGEATGTATTGADGVTAVADRRSGLHLITLASEDGVYRGRASLDLVARRTELRGALGLDADDADGDGDRSEPALILEALPDGDGDNISDTGHRSWWVFTAGGGALLRHSPLGTTERIRLDDQHLEADIESFADLDGDFIPDESDPDVDGDGKLNSEEPDDLPCPSFSHQPLQVAGSKHADMTCERCHARAEDRPPYACDDCHVATGRAPEDVPAATPTEHYERRCERCHLASAPWPEVPGPDGFNHQPFPLLGQHLRTDCYTCHLAGNAKPEQRCQGCHLADAAADHYQSGCEVCHSSRSWAPATASHDQFPLSGGHANVACDGCHLPPIYSGLSQDCVSCHLEDAPPKHAPAGFTEKACDDCHSLDGWPQFRYPHNQWLLVERHATVRCDQCHLDPNTYAGNSQACETCHQTPVFPDHSDPMIFGPDCERCHSEVGWVPSRNNGFDHNFWPLTGSHQTALCSTCHQMGQLPHPPNNCKGCHDADKPARHVGRFDGECNDCHQATAWAELTMPWQHIDTFPLTGAHATQLCSACHTTSYAIDTGCVSCHATDTPPNHYGNDCASCHTPDNWNPSGSMNHHTADPNAFPLTNAHGSLLCSDCHQGGTFGPLARECTSCHRDDAPLGHATDGCERCHSTIAFTNPTQPPRGVIHPLGGGHAGQTCSGCHGSYAAGRFATPDPNSTCATCHTLPQGHIATGGAACEGCHSVSGWLPASGGHEGPVPSSPFPYNTFSGRWFPVPHHSARQCNQCHTQIATRGYAFFSCTTQCHRNSNDMNDKHNNGRDSGNRLFHFFHFDPNATHTPANEGGGPWGTAHVGCVKNGCHADGRE